MTTGAPYAPFEDPRTAKAPGLSPLDPADWLRVDADFAAQIAERDRLIAEAPDRVVAAAPEAVDAVAEFRAMLLDHLRGRPEWTVGAASIRRPDGAEVSVSEPTLALAGRLCAEDFLLMSPEREEPRLVAGVLCFPSRWTLAEKLGRALTPIHAPVDYYDDALARRVRRVFAALAPERPLVRVNWNLQMVDALFQPLREGEPGPPRESWTGPVLRTERQTIRRLPETGASVFAIKTTVTPLADLTPAQRAALREAIAGWERRESAYHGGEERRAAVAALDDVLDGAFAAI